MAIGEIHEVKFEAMTYGGEALGHLADGRVILVPFALAGERARVRVMQERKGLARGQIVELLQPSSERVTPRCKHFGICGGCHYQHTDYEHQLDIKTRILREQFTRIGKLERPPVQAAIPSPRAWNYRNQVQFHVKRNGRLGYVRADGEGVIAVEECHLPEEVINQAWPQIDLEEGLEVQRVNLRAGADDDVMLLLEGDNPALPELEVQGDMSVVQAFGEEAITMSGAGQLTMNVLGRAFQVSAPSFFQVNTAAAEKMVEHVLKLLPAETPTIVDAYCGVGLFSAFMAPRAGRLIGIESSAAACRDFEVNLDEFDNVELFEAPTQDVLPALQFEVNVIVLDPPRAGLGTGTVEALIKLRPEMIIYVSCDPSTLARDLRQLVEAGYLLQQVTPFDLFPQTYHIESISLLRRKE